MSILRPIIALGLVLLLSSCGRTSAPQGHRHSESEEIYHAGKGLQLSKALKDRLGIEMTEVEERTIGTTVTATAQVYRGAAEPGSRDGTYRTGFAYASATVPIDEIQGLKDGQAVTIRSHAASAVPQEARIHRLDDALRKTMGSAEVLLAIPDAEKRLTVGSFLMAEFSRPGGAAVIVVPRSALLRPVGGPCVYVQNSQNLLRTAVKTGTGDAQWVEIRDGLLPGDVVVSRGAHELWLIELRATQGGGGCGCQ
ncbi:MAG: hypothetical protein PHV34_15985 [Verrucomicrobiae bacterium]|nr:hypothetical protein [Verrucomicrobiae bacterium]